MTAMRVNERYFRQNRMIDQPDVVFYDAGEAVFGIYGFHAPRGSEGFARIPRAVAEQTSQEVLMLHRNTAGGRIRFATDSPFVAVRTSMNYIAHRSIMSLLCSAGFDIYVRQGGHEFYAGSFSPPIDMEDGFEGIFHFPDASWREITLYCPLYNDVDALSIGIAETAELTPHAPYTYEKPVLYYGSSITQGACASRAGMAYEAMIARKMDGNFINLGFAGSAKGEDAIVEHMAGLDYRAFVCDYDHNAPTAEHLEATHQKLYQKIRRAHPDIPILLVSRITPAYNRADTVRRREVVYNTYANGRKNGDEALYFIDGFGLLGEVGRTDCLADGLHPNDLGLFRMAEKIGHVLHAALGTPLL